jgi:hypothetical protein
LSRQSGTGWPGAFWTGALPAFGSFAGSAGFASGFGVSGADVAVLGGAAGVRERGAPVAGR